MKKNVNRILTATILATLLFTKYVIAQYAVTETVTQKIPEGIYSYLETDGERAISFSWKAEERSNGIAIIVEEQGKSFYNLCADDGDTLIWHMQIEGKHDISALRKENTLHIEGIRFGKEYSRTVTIDERPWYQPLSFSLGNFLNSYEMKTSFWVIRADEIEVIALTAEKLGVEKIVLDGAEIPAQKIEIRADGFYSRFWHATYWYRESDNLFLRYQSTHGLPGSAETIVELIGTPDQRGIDS